MLRPFIALLLLLLSLAMPAAYAQDDYLELYARHARPRMYVDAVVLPAANGADTHFIVRIPNSLLVFVREREPLAGAPFVARVDVTVQVRSGEDVVAERTLRVAHTAESYEASVSRSLDLVGRIPIRLEPGDYAYRVLLRSTSDDDFLPLPPRALHVPSFADGAVGTPIAATAVPGADHFTPAGLAGDVPFERKSTFLVPVTLPENGTLPAALSYAVWALPEDARPERRRLPEPVDASDRERWARVETEKIELDDARRVADGTVPASEWVGFLPSTKAGEPTSGVEVPLTTVDPARAFLAPVPVPDVSDRSARFAIETWVEGSAERGRAVVPFSFLWRDMPIALHDPETAIRLLSYIESDDRVRQLLHGSAADREEAILAYWRGKDPTPGTRFNELMAEYYRRIDHAALTYRTGGTPLPNGLRTDQARVYIVHGPPDDVGRAFPPSGGVEETWSYDSGRRFVFWAASSLDPLALQRD